MRANSPTVPVEKAVGLKPASGNSFKAWTQPGRCRMLKTFKALVSRTNEEISLSTLVIMVTTGFLVTLR